MRKLGLSLFFVALLAVLFSAVGLSCANFWAGNNTGTTETPVATAPVISPSGGSFPDASLVVSITTPSAGAFVYWTSDDSNPTTQSNLYSEPIRIWGTTTIKAISVVSGTASPVARAALALNTGKGANQQGVIKGTVTVGTADGGLDYTLVNIFSDQLPGVVKHPAASGFFILDGLDTTKNYTIYLTNQDVGPVRDSRRIAPNPMDKRALTNGSIVAAQILSALPEAGSGLSLGDVKLKKTGSISGTVTIVGRDGKPIEDRTGIDVYVPGTSYFAKTDAKGAFVLSSIPQGYYHIRAEKSGFSFEERSQIAVVSEKDTPLSESFTIYFGYGTVTGQALLRDGSTDSLACDGITVLLSNTITGMTYNTVSNTAGTYSVANVEPGPYIALFSKDGYVSQSLDGISVEGAKIAKLQAVTLPITGGTVSGSVKAKDMVDFGGSMIVARNDVSGKIFSTSTIADGTWSINPISPGTYTITATRSGFGTQSLRGVAIVTSASLTNLEFPTLVPATGTITGTVSLEGAASFEGIGVTIRKSDDATQSFSAITDKSGTWYFSGLKPATWLVLFSKDGWLSGVGTSVTLISDEVATAPAVLLGSSKARLSGTATLESGSDSAGIAILATGDLGKTASTVTDATGHWALAGLEPDSYRVQATKDGFVTSLSDPVSLSAGGAVSDIAQTLKVSSRSLVGKIKLEGSTAASGVKITATNIADVRSIYSALSNNDGYYVLAGMIPGFYILSFSKETYKGVTTKAIALDKTSMVEMDDVALDKARGSVSGIVLSEGRKDNAGTRVVLVGTTIEATTNASGVWSLDAPSGNYPGGVRFERIDFQTTADTETITVLTDSTYGVPTKTLAATANSATGKVDLVNSTDEGISVSIDSHTDFTATTAADGSWRIDHIPLGSYTIRFSKLNTPEATSALEVKPCDIVNLGSLEMVPNASTLSGYIKLSGMTDSSGILVTVATSGKPDRTGLSDSGGHFTVDNIYSTGSHAVTAHKAGWDDWTTTISDFQPLETRRIGVSPEIALADTTKAVVSGVLINEGANITDKPDVTIRFSLAEVGSGADRMQVSWDGVFDVEPWEPYAAAFTKTVPANGNGDYTISIRVRDKAGNVSEAGTDTIQLSNLNVTLNGVLKGDDLHWKASRGIYKVVGTMVVEAGDTLIVDPGVEVQFTGSFSLAVRGTIQVRGTKGAPVIFTKDSALTGKWGGIAIQGDPTTFDSTGYGYSSGTIVEYAKFSHGETALSSGNMGMSTSILVRHCVFDNTNTTISSASGSGLFFDNDVSCGFNLSGKVVNSIFHDLPQGTYPSTSLSGAIVRNCTFTRLGTVSKSTSPTMYMSSSMTMPYSLVNSEIYDVGQMLQTSSGLYSYNNIYNLWAEKPVRGGSGISNATDARNTFWGNDKLAELTLIGSAGNVSFIYDYYDDPINTGKVLYYPYASSPWDFAGYKGDDFIDADFNINNYSFTSDTMMMASQPPEPTSPGITIQPKVLFANNTITGVRIAQSVSDLLAASWSAYSSSLPWTIDTAKLVDGYAEICIQVKDSLGNVSGVASHKIAYDTPIISKLNISEGKAFTTESEYTIKYTIRDAGKLTSRELYLNGFKIEQETSTGGCMGSNGYAAEGSKKLRLSDMGPGAYSIKIVISDEAARTSSQTVNFTIDRTVVNSGWGGGASWNATTGQPLKDSGTTYLWHLDSDTAEVSHNSSWNMNGTLGTAGLGGGSISGYGDIPSLVFAPSPSTNAYTIDFWEKGKEFYLRGGPFGDINSRSSYIGSYWYYTSGTTSASDSFWWSFNPVTDTSWHHYAFVFAGTRVLFYIDGILVIYKDGFSQTLFNSTNNFYGSFSSSVDEVRLSSFARSGDELRAYVEQAKPKIVP
jgi:hypothetical protein